MEKGSSLHGLWTVTLEKLVLRGLFYTGWGLCSRGRSISAEVLAREDELRQVYKGRPYTGVRGAVCARFGIKIGKQDND